MLVYLASPLGFSPEHINYLAKIVATLTSAGHCVLNPWAINWSEDIEACHALTTVAEQKEAFSKLAFKIGHENWLDISRAQCVLAVLDGTEPDSGTVAELGYAAGMGKTVYGLRTDLRDVGDLPHVPINLQVLFFIENSGGQLFRNISHINLKGGDNNAI
jgi:nucleoside 2-deoxyribosyltransferase